MALTWTITSRNKIGKLTQLLGTIAWDSSYATGGEDFAAGLKEVLYLNVPPNSGYMFETDYTNKTIKAYNIGTHTHNLLLKSGDQADGSTTRVNATTDKLGQNAADVTVTGLAYGASTHGGVVGAAAGAGAEVANTTNLASLTATPFIAYLLHT